jgi:hypothetical protein
MTESFNWIWQENSPQVRGHVEREIERLLPHIRKAAQALYDLDWGDMDEGTTVIEDTPEHEISMPLHVLFIGKPPGRSFSLSLSMPTSGDEVSIYVNEEILHGYGEEAVWVSLRHVCYVDDIPLKQLGVKHRD